MGASHTLLYPTRTRLRRGSNGSICTLHFINFHSNLLAGSIPPSWGSSFGPLGDAYLLGLGGAHRPALPHVPPHGNRAMPPT